VIAIHEDRCDCLCVNQQFKIVRARRMYELDGHLAILCLAGYSMVYCLANLAIFLSGTLNIFCHNINIFKKNIVRFVKNIIGKNVDNYIVYNPHPNIDSILLLDVYLLPVMGILFCVINVGK